ncbi:hypothetical protein CMO93_02555 [Candidatus Woesearchaeota archaeon]|nr:hypothetical protein [Candidatus Woesearchaeota archaeon]|tara:strand:- start:917 stop:1162 length:246 start_codon:yes stop_codon:yes gene_type:complete
MNYLYLINEIKMDIENLIRSAIFLVAGLISIFFRKELNSFKNRVLAKLNMKSKDERKSYVYFGIVFIIISIALFLYAIYQG